jgi:hypothetical protein
VLNTQQRRSFHDVKQFQRPRSTDLFLERNGLRSVEQSSLFRWLPTVLNPLASGQHRNSGSENTRRYQGATNRLCRSTARYDSRPAVPKFNYVSQRRLMRHDAVVMNSDRVRYEKSSETPQGFGFIWQRKCRRSYSGL